MALYYFTEEAAAGPALDALPRAPRGRGRTRAAIAADRVALDLYDRLKRRLGISDDGAHRVLGVFDRLRRKRH